MKYLPTIKMNSIEKSSTQKSNSILDRITYQPQVDHFYMERSGILFPLPPNTTGNEIVKEDYINLATKIDKIFDKVSKVIPQCRLDLRPSQAYGTYTIGMYNTDEDLGYIIGTNWIKSRDLYGHWDSRCDIWSDCAIDHCLVNIEYGFNTSPKIDFSQGYFSYFLKYLGVDTEFIKQMLSYDEFSYLFDKAVTNMDNLFLAQGFKPTIEKRSNLVSLAFDLHSNIATHPEVVRLLGISPDVSQLSNPRLIQAAEEGYNDSIIKLFYSHKYFPKDTQEMLELKALSYTLLSPTLGIKN